MCFNFYNFFLNQEKSKNIGKNMGTEKIAFEAILNADA